MQSIYPKKLSRGDEIRVIAPSRSLAIISRENRKIANQRIHNLGMRVSFANHVDEIDDFSSSSISSRVVDIHEAFLDKNVTAILTAIGGYNSNQLLPYLDWEIIRNNPKIFCGFSDITALNNAIFTKTGLVTYSGPHYSTFGMQKYFEYVMTGFTDCLMDDTSIEIHPVSEWTDDAWFLNQQERIPIKNDGSWSITDGVAEGTIIGGNLCTFNLLQGTEYLPNFKGVILFLEDDAESSPHHFDRNLTSLIQQIGFEGVSGILIGRFQKKSGVNREIIEKIIHSKKELESIPVIANVDFGHTNQIITYPIGGTVSIKASKEESQITIVKH